MTTGLGIPPQSEAQVEYVERLAAVGAAGVALGENMNAPPLQPQMLQAADRHRLPLLLTRYEIPFIALARAVADASAEARLARIAQTERVYEVLRRASADEADLADLIGSLEAVVECRLFVVDPATGRSLVRGVTVPAPLVEAVLHWFPGNGQESPTPLGVSDSQAVGVLLPTTRPAALLACPRIRCPTTRCFATWQPSPPCTGPVVRRTRAHAAGRRDAAGRAAGPADRSLGGPRPARRGGLSPAHLVLGVCAIGDRPDPHLLRHQLSERQCPT